MALNCVMFQQKANIIVKLTQSTGLKIRQILCGYSPTKATAHKDGGGLRIPRLIPRLIPKSAPGSPN